MSFFNKRKKLALSAVAFAILCIIIITALVLIYKSYTKKLIIQPETSKQNISISVKLKESDRQYFVERGLNDPASDIIRDLMNHNELIPCRGTLGGTPGFYDPNDIKIINRNRVKAHFEDGHESGSVTLSLNVDNGRIEWKVLHADCGP